VVEVHIRKLARFDLEAVIPIATPQPLHKVSPHGQCPWLPLFKNMTVLVQHEPRILEEIGGAATQVNSTVARRSEGAAMEADEQRMLNNPHVTDLLAKQKL